MGNNGLKTTLLAVVLFMVGAVAGYYFSGFNKIKPIKLSQKRQWVKLDFSKANLLMKNYEDGQLSQSHPLLANDTSYLKGFWIDMKMLDSINKIVRKNLNDNGKIKINGYHIFLGREDQTDKHSLLVRASVDSIVYNKNKLDTLIVSAGDYFDMIDPCPHNCGTNY